MKAAPENRRPEAAQAPDRTVSRETVAPLAHLERSSAPMGTLDCIAKHGLACCVLAGCLRGGRHEHHRPAHNWP